MNRYKLIIEKLEQVEELFFSTLQEAINASCVIYLNPEIKSIKIDDMYNN